MKNSFRDYVDMLIDKTTSVIAFVFYWGLMAYGVYVILGGIFGFYHRR